MQDFVASRMKKFEPFVRAWLSAWNDHSIERIMEHYASDVIVKSPFLEKAVPGSGGTVTGRVKLESIYADAFLKYPDLEFELISYFASVESVVIHYRSVQNLLAAETFLFNSNGEAKQVLCHYAPNGTT
jgi:hypothetical protein